MVRGVGAAGKGGKQANVEDVYLRDEVATLQEKIEWMEQQMEASHEAMQEAIATLTGQLATLFSGSRQQHQHRNRHLDEDEVTEGEFVVNPFARQQPRGEFQRVMVDNRDRQWESDMKVKIPEFHGGLTPKEFVDWVAIVYETLELKEVPEAKRVPLVATRL